MKKLNMIYVPKSNEFMKQAEKIAWTDSTNRIKPVGVVVVRISDNMVVAREASKVTPWFLLFYKKYSLFRHNFLHLQKYYAQYRAIKKIIKNGFDKNDKFDLYLWGHHCPNYECLDKIPVRNIILLEESEILFNEKAEGNIVGHQFDKYYLENEQWLLIQKNAS